MNLHRFFLNIYIFFIIVAIPVTNIFSFELFIDAEQNISTEEQSQQFNTALTHNFNNTLFIADLSYYTDSKYSPAMGGDFYSGYFFMEQGGFIWEGDNLGLSIGRLNPVPLIESPYSLFISSNENAAVTGNFYIESDHFFFQSQWLQLNQDSMIATDEFKDGFPDRGANIRYYGLQFGDLRLGLNDSSVYFGRSFDLEYFINPIPSILMQYINNSEGNPWQHNDNENALIGFFIDYTQPEYYTYAQLILDDLNIHMLFDDSYTNPTKLGWSLGGTYDFPFGTIGFYQAGATKYLFEPTRNSDPYGFTYYPDTIYTLIDGTQMAITPEDNYIGYKYGENNLAFQITYIPNSKIFKLKDFNFQGELEFVLSGSKSPVNPWHQYTEYQQGGLYTKMFDEPILEKKLSLTVYVQKKLSDSFLLYSNIELGYIWNRLELTSVASEFITYYENEDSDYDSTLKYDTEYLQYYSPSSNSEPIVNFTLGVQYSYSPF